MTLKSNIIKVHLFDIVVRVIALSGIHEKGLFCLSFVILSSPLFMSETQNDL